jgi:hypothetical protein
MMFMAQLVSVLFSLEKPSNLSSNIKAPTFTQAIHTPDRKISESWTRSPVPHSACIKIFDM